MADQPKPFLQKAIDSTDPICPYCGIPGVSVRTSEDKENVWIGSALECRHRWTQSDLRETIAPTPLLGVGMLDNLLEVADRNKSWKTFRHASALVNLLKGLGVWAKCLTGGGLLVGAVVGYLAELPVWGRIMVGLGAAALSSIAMLAAAMALSRISNPPRIDEADMPGNPPSRKRYLIILVPLGLTVILVAGSWLLYKPKPSPLTPEEEQQLELLHENAILKYEAYQKELSALYKQENDLMRSVCKGIKVPEDRIASDCRIDLPKNVKYAVTAPDITERGCFSYDPAALYVTNKVFTMFSLNRYTILGDRNWPVAFTSQGGADDFLRLARNYKQACFIGGVGKSSLSDVVFEWPSAVSTPVGLCQKINSELAVLESSDASFVTDGGAKIIRVDTPTEAQSVVRMAQGHSSLCVVGGVPDVNAQSQIIGLPLSTGDRVIYLQ